MAEFVQLNVEEMLPELEQMERVGLFTKHETRKILKKRKHHEYKLRRRTKVKEDYLQYIQYEVNVLSLVKKRRERTGYNFKKFEIDVAIVQRIHKLFRMACSRFQDDVKLWLSHIEFSKQRKEKATISRLYTRMLQVHSRKPDLWILAAKWEFEDHGNTDNARSLLQRGLRFNPEAKHLWLEYYRLELLNADKLRKRREILGLENEDENEETESDVQDAVLAGQVAQIVYKKALEAFPGDVEFCLSFLPVCKLFDFTQDMTEDVYNELKTHYGDSPFTWNAVARQCLEEKLLSTNKEGRVEERIALEKKACQVYENAVAHLNNEVMWTAYLLFCIERIPLNPGNRSLTDSRIARALEIFERAEEEKYVSEEMYLEWIAVLVNTSQITRAIEVANLARSTKYPASVQLWMVSLQLAIRSDAPEKELFKIMNKALNSVHKKDALPIYQLMIDWAIAAKSEKINDLFKAGMSKRSCVGCPIKEVYVEWLGLTRSIKKVREEYNRLSKVKPVSVNFFNKFIMLERCQDQTDVVRLRQIYEDAISEYGNNNPDLWLDYIKLELTEGDAMNSGKIHWRAMKQLDGRLTEEFVSRHTILQTGHQD
ncbi:U3 small nucleolar RNA-associated protein 6 homolog [Lineus longissimus]|uniref:U3 small nucleolar RNA-associated protein 6 homolog n=1 Tax=Lineus longissimus TaxID=88925 RepID=UPI002B4DB484